MVLKVSRVFRPDTLKTKNFYFKIPILQFVVFFMLEAILLQCSKKGFLKNGNNAVKKNNKSLKNETKLWVSKHLTKFNKTNLHFHFQNLLFLETVKMPTIEYRHCYHPGNFPGQRHWRISDKIVDWWLLIQKFRST